MSSPLYTQEQFDIAILKEQTSGFKNSLDRIDSELKSMDKKIDSNFKWLLLAIAGLGGIMAHGFNWF